MYAGLLVRLGNRLGWYRFMVLGHMILVLCRFMVYGSRFLLVFWVGHKVVFNRFRPKGLMVYDIAG